MKKYNLLFNRETHYEETNEHFLEVQRGGTSL